MNEEAARAPKTSAPTADLIALWWPVTCRGYGLCGGWRRSCGWRGGRGCCCGRRRWHEHDAESAARLGLGGEDEVGIGGAEGGTVVERAAQDREADRIERHRQRSTDDEQGLAGLVDVLDAKASQLGVRRRVQQGQDPDGRLVGVDVGLGGPATEEAALVGEAQRCPLKPRRVIPGRSLVGSTSHSG